MSNIVKIDKKNSAKGSIKAYFKGIKSEWSKITWPNRRQVFVETLYVIIIVFVFTIFILLLDLTYKGIFKIFHLQ